MSPGRCPPYRERMGFVGPHADPDAAHTDAAVGWGEEKVPPPSGALGRALAVVHRANAVAEEVQAAPHRPHGAGDVAGINRWPPCRAINRTKKVCAVV